MLCVCLIESDSEDHIHTHSANLCTDGPHCGIPPARPAGLASVRYPARQSSGHRWVCKHG